MLDGVRAFAKMFANVIHGALADFAFVFGGLRHAKGFAEWLVNSGNNLLLRGGCLFRRLTKRTGARISHGAGNRWNDAAHGNVRQACGCAALSNCLKVSAADWPYS